MAEGRRKFSVNLSSNRASYSIEKIFFKWALNVGRIIIIGTELIALGALSYRFIIDRQIVDLHDKIQIKETQIKSQAAQEKKFRDLQARLGFVKTISGEVNAKIEVFNKVLEAVRVGSLSVKSLSVTGNVIALDGTTPSIFAVNTFIETLKQNEHVRAMSIDDLSSSDVGINFKVSITLAESKLHANERN